MHAQDPPLPLGKFYICSAEQYVDASVSIQLAEYPSVPSTRKLDFWASHLVSIKQTTSVFQ
jgi:hypothetical protein